MLGLKLDPTCVRLIEAHRTPWGWQLVASLSVPATPQSLALSVDGIAVGFGAQSVVVTPGQSAREARVEIVTEDLAPAATTPVARRLAVSRYGDVLWNPDTAPHLLVAGATGSGKSNAIEHFILSLCVDKTPWRFVLVDLKGVTFGPLAGSGRVTDVAIDPASATAVLERVVGEVYRRRDLLLGAQVSHWRQVAAFLPSPIVVVVDEVTELLTAGVPSEEARERRARLETLRTMLATVARLGRFVGVHLVLGMQRPDAAVLGGGELRDNMSVRLALGAMSADGLAMMFGSSARHLSMPSEPGHGYIAGVRPADVAPMECRIPLVDRSDLIATLEDGATDCLLRS